ncbi:MAG: RIP metalloprotease RseP [Candidatus Taylorbacteria bacterium RIFCSPLOWO2_12_FULL_47_20]|uniref:Zinc metalloprotease n=1 Tax=Candidatus Taylorbacteria bacterium RIFCSPLOWO2_12_FULL_47_20 TaxID=1802335 RepID=A0A1G2P813_9BACT|nr:MAG: RIP metalloprotease RseP [Candidatus Taylorbacteria bacterium RIFCSPLOWO2_12_FULL_47_20]
MTIILFIIVLAILVFVHELGHFLVAKRSGVRVDEFGIGFPPRLFGFKKGETLYSINLIPFGGFVKIFGENGETGETVPAQISSGGNVARSPLSDSRSFVNQKRRTQALILVAGVLFNFVFGWLLIGGSYTVGSPVSVEGYEGNLIGEPRLLVISVVPESPAAKAGLKVGDEIVSISGGGNTDSDPTIDDVQRIILQAGSVGGSVDLRVKRGGEDTTKAIVPVATGGGENNPVIGIGMDRIGVARMNIFSALYQGFKTSVNMGVVVAVNLFSLILDAVLGRADLSNVAGPVGIAGLVGDAGRLGFTYLMSFTAFISINLAVLNLLPFPALDGGRLVFVAIEAIRRKPVSAKVTAAVNTAGFLLLLVLIAVITWNDIARLL